MSMRDEYEERFLDGIEEDDMRDVDEGEEFEDDDDGDYFSEDSFDEDDQDEDWHASDPHRITARCEHCGGIHVMRICARCQTEICGGCMCDEEDE